MAVQTSHLQSLVVAKSPDSRHPVHLVNLAKTIVYNLEHEHNWTSVHIHFSLPLNPSQALPRPLISGLPRSRIYIHPDEQVENLIKEKRGEEVDDTIEREWVLPSHLTEKWSLRRFAECFDAVTEAPPVGDDGIETDQQNSSSKRRGGKRMLLATLGMTALWSIMLCTMASSSPARTESSLSLGSSSTTCASERAMASSAAY